MGPVPAMCFSIQLAFGLTIGFCDPAPWSPWARACPAKAAKKRPVGRILRRSFVGYWVRKCDLSDDRFLSGGNCGVGNGVAAVISFLSDADASGID